MTAADLVSSTLFRQTVLSGFVDYFGQVSGESEDALLRNLEYMDLDVVSDVDPNIAVAGAAGLAAADLTSNTTVGPTGSAVPSGAIGNATGMLASTTGLPFLLERKGTQTSTNTQSSVDNLLRGLVNLLNEKNGKQDAKPEDAQRQIESLKTALQHHGSFTSEAASSPVQVLRTLLQEVRHDEDNEKKTEQEERNDHDDGEGVLELEEELRRGRTTTSSSTSKNIPHIHIHRIRDPHATGKEGEHALFSTTVEEITYASPSEASPSEEGREGEESTSFLQLVQSQSQSSTVSEQNKSRSASISSEEQLDPSGERLRRRTLSRAMRKANKHFVANYLLPAGNKNKGTTSRTSRRHLHNFQETSRGGSRRGGRGRGGQHRRGLSGTSTRSSKNQHSHSATRRKKARTMSRIWTNPELSLSTGRRKSSSSVEDTNLLNNAASRTSSGLYRKASSSSSLASKMAANEASLAASADAKSMINMLLSSGKTEQGNHGRRTNAASALGVGSGSVLRQTPPAGRFQMIKVSVSFGIPQSKAAQVDASIPKDGSAPPALMAALSNKLAQAAQIALTGVVMTPPSSPGSATGATGSEKDVIKLLREMLDKTLAGLVAATNRPQIIAGGGGGGSDLITKYFDPVIMAMLLKTIMRAANGRSAPSPAINITIGQDMLGGFTGTSGGPQLPVSVNGASPIGVGGSSGGPNVVYNVGYNTNYDGVSLTRPEEGSDGSVNSNVDTTSVPAASASAASAVGPAPAPAAGGRGAPPAPSPARGAPAAARGGRANASPFLIERSGGYAQQAYGMPEWVSTLLQDIKDLKEDERDEESS
ncbi:unnamed protein product [Amoebophrya sp. A25]|nr:unnamed protein product [Amoebophrya sp. A25]|eukprot:GSA25T00017972001.1